MLDFDILKQYKDACALCEEIDRELEQLHKDRGVVVSDCVTGSDSHYPYTARKFTVNGLSLYDTIAADRKEKILLSRKAVAQRAKDEAEELLGNLPVRIQRIARYKYIDGLSWEKVADRMGGRSTGGSLRKELARYLKNKKN